MQHAMMRPAEPIGLQQPVGVADEIAVGEVEQLDHFVHRRGLGPRADFGVGVHRGARRYAKSAGLGSGSARGFATGLGTGVAAAFSISARARATCSAQPSGR